MKQLKFALALSFISCYALSLSAQEITMFPGMWGEQFYKDKEKIGWKEVGTLMETNPTADMNWKKSKKQITVAFAAQTANLGFGIWYLVSENEDKSTTAPIIGFLGTGAVGGIFYFMSMKSKKNAILEYNDSLGKGTSFRLVPTSNENGVGLALKF